MNSGSYFGRNFWNSDPSCLPIMFPSCILRPQRWAAWQHQEQFLAVRGGDRRGGQRLEIVGPCIFWYWNLNHCRVCICLAQDQYCKGFSRHQQGTGEGFCRTAGKWWTWTLEIYFNNQAYMIATCFCTVQVACALDFTFEFTWITDRKNWYNLGTCNKWRRNVCTKKLKSLLRRIQTVNNWQWRI